MADLSGTQEIAKSHIELEEFVRRRAYEIYLSRGTPSSELDDWLQAEREILGDSKQPAQDRGTTVGDTHTPYRIL
jgi:hypothetical protein